MVQPYGSGNSGHLPQYVYDCRSHASNSGHLPQYVYDCRSHASNSGHLPQYVYDCTSHASNSGHLTQYVYDRRSHASNSGHLPLPLAALRTNGQCWVIIQDCWSNLSSAWELLWSKLLIYKTHNEQIIFKDRIYCESIQALLGVT